MEPTILLELPSETNSYSSPFSYAPVNIHLQYFIDTSYLDANGGTLPDSDIGNEGAALLIADILDTRYMLGNMSLDTTIPVGTADAGSYFNTLVLEAVDYGVSPFLCTHN